MAQAKVRGISGPAIVFLVAGGWLVFAGITDTPVIGGLREFLSGKTPVGRASPLEFRGAPTTIGSTGQGFTGKLVQVPGTKIIVDSSIVGQVQDMVRAAKEDGVVLNGSGFRSVATQAALRISNGCPDVNTSSASSCRVPTARPGESEHQKGLAIDFDNARSTSTKVFRWLKANAGAFGFRNLPGEPWHWSTSGR